MEMYWLRFIRNNISRYKCDGCRVDDIIYHAIKCPKCMQKFTCVVNTYRGGGSFKKIMDNFNIFEQACKYISVRMSELKDILNKSFVTIETNKNKQQIKTVCCFFVHILFKKYLLDIHQKECYKKFDKFI